MSIKIRRRNRLPEEILSKRNLPLKPEPIELVGSFIKIRPLDIERDSKELYMISNGSPICRHGKSTESYDPNELIWKWTANRPFQNLNDFTEYLRHTMDMANTRLFTIFDAVEDYQIGVCGYRMNNPEHLRISIEE